MKYKYWSVFEHYEEADRPKRRVYTFDNEMAANDLLEFLIRNDPMIVFLKVEEHETTT